MAKKTPLHEELSTALVEAMDVRGLNQTQTADFLGVTQGVISGWLSGTTAPDFDRDVMDKMQDLLNVDHKTFAALMLETKIRVKERRRRPSL